MDLIQEIIDLAKQINEESLSYAETGEVAEANGDNDYAEVCWGKACMCQNIVGRLISLAERAVEAKKNGDSIF